MRQCRSSPTGSIPRKVRASTGPHPTGGRLHRRKWADRPERRTSGNRSARHFPSGVRAYDGAPKERGRGSGFLGLSRGCSSAGRAAALQAVGRGFESLHLHDVVGVPTARFTSLPGPHEPCGLLSSISADRGPTWVGLVAPVLAVSARRAPPWSPFSCSISRARDRKIGVAAPARSTVLRTSGAMGG